MEKGAGKLSRGGSIAREIKRGGRKLEDLLREELRGGRTGSAW
jgi:hypothetical protein